MRYGAHVITKIQSKSSFNLSIESHLKGHNVLKSHAVVYHMYKKSFYNRYPGQVGISNLVYSYYSTTNDTSVVDFAQRFFVSSDFI